MKKKILYIEDDPILQKTLGRKLKVEGFKVISALDGKEGLILVQKERPDLILLDLILPQMGGVEFLKELRKNEETKDIPVVVLTNVSKEIEKIQQILELGIKGYLVKSEYSLEEIVEKIKEFLK
jgi:DNA-binding response OmpR family regulator